jgi:hypothetical protein
MANQTLTANQNYDDAAISGLLNGEDVTLSGFRLTINSDTRWGQQAAVIGNAVYSSTIGGDVTIDGTTVWWMAYDAPSGNVPALGTAGTQDCTGGTSGATGEFLGIWSAIPESPVAAAASIPATGWIKFRSKVGTFVDNETVTLPGGATIVVNSATGGQRGWLHVVGEALNNVSVPRLGSHVTTGDWFELGTTNGADDQTFAIPVLDHIPAIWVETAVASGVYEIWLNGGTRWGTSTQFIPTDARGKYFGQWVEINGNATNASPTITTATTTGLVVGMPVNNHHNAVTAPIADGSVITAINPGVSITLSKNATSTAATVIRTPTALLTIARRATNSCGFKPVTGLRVRVPNVFCSTSDSSSWTGNQCHLSATSRYELNASNAGTITVDKASMLWYHNVSGAYTYSVTNCGVSHSNSFLLGNFATPMVFNDNGAGLEGLISFSLINGSAMPFGGQIRRNRTARGVNVGIADRTITMSDCANLNIDYNQLEHFGGAGITDRSSGDNRMCEVTRFTDCTFDNNTFIGGSLLVSTSVRCHARNHVFADRINGTTNATIPLSPIIYQASCTDCVIEGLSIFAGLTNVHPYNPLVTLQTSSERVKVRNIGTYASPFPAGSANKCFGAVTLSSVFNCEVNRIYMDDTRSFLINGFNNANGCVIDNVFGGYASSCFVNPLNTTMRGLRATTPTTGAAAVYGSHWLDQFDSATTGRISIQCNEPTAASAAQCAVTAGTPRFTSAGIVAMPTLGDQITWTMPYFAIGHTAFVASDVVVTATNSGNFSYEFQVDTGSGFSAWAAATSANLTAIGSWAAATGVKLKVRATVTTAAADNSLTQLRFLTVSDTTSQQIQYPFQFTAAITVSPIVAGSRVQIYNVTTDTEIFNEVVDDTSLNFQYYDGTEASTGDEIRIRIRKRGQESVTLSTVVTATGGSFLPSQGTDIHCSGATPANYSVDVINLKIRATGVRANFTVQEIADIICLEQATEDGIRLAEFANISGLVELSPGVETGITVDLLGWQLSWASGSVAQASVTGGNLVGGIAGDPVEDIVGGPQVTINLSAAATAVTANVPTAADVATAVRAELATELARIDAAITSRLATAGYTVPPTSAAVATQVRTELGTELGRIDATVSSRATQTSVDAIPTTPLLAASYVVPLDSTATQAAAAAALTAYDPPTKAELDSAVAGIPTAPSAASNASAVRSELSVELGRMDAAISSRSTYAGADTSGTATLLSRVTGAVLLASNYTTPPSVDAIRTEMDTNSTKLANLDVTVSSRNAIAPATPANVTTAQNNVIAALPAAAPSAASNASAVRSELAIELARIDVATSSRNATTPPTAAANASAVRSELAMELGRVDAAVSSRSTYAGADTSGTTTLLSRVTGAVLLASNYTTPPTVTQIRTEMEVVGGKLSNVGDQVDLVKAKTDNLPASPASTTNITGGTITTVTNLTNAPTNGDLTATMKASVTTAATAATPTVADTSGTTTLLTRVTGAVLLASNYTAPLDSTATQAAAAAALNAYDAPTKAELDSAVAPLATTTNLDTLPTLAEMEASTILAKEATSQLIHAKTTNLPASPAAVGSAMTLTSAYDAAKTAASQASVDGLAIAGSPVTYTATSATRVIGDDDGGTVTNLAALDGSYFITGESSSLGLEVTVDLSASSLLENPSLCRVVGSYRGAASHTVVIYVWNYITASWESKAVMADRSTDFAYVFPVGIDNANSLTGAMRLRFKHSGTSFSNSHSLNLDYIAWEKVASSSSIGSDIAQILANQHEAMVQSVIHSGVAQGGTGNTITLSSESSQLNGSYDPSIITIYSGTGAGQSRIVLQYIGATHVAVVNRDWREIPDESSTYVIHPYADIQTVNEGLITSATSNTARLNIDASTVNGTYIGQIIAILSGTGADQTATITGYNGSTQTATIAGNWVVTPDSTSAYVMLPVSPVMLANATHTGAVIPTVTALTDVTNIREEIERIGGTLSDVKNGVVGITGLVA